MHVIQTHLLSIGLAADDASLVERPGPGRAPSAFRIWAAGENVTDEGQVNFTPASAEAVIEEQAARGRLYPFDFDHLSVVTDRPAESGRAAGWHRLAVRESATGPELWAVDIEWCADVKAGLESKPPLWRYFSPAFRTIDSEVTSYINCALCINPLTHQLPSLASESDGRERTSSMKPQSMNANQGLKGAELAEYNRQARKREPVTTLAQILEDGSMRVNMITASELRALEKSGAPRIAAYRGSR